MKLFKLAFVTLAILSFAIACNNAPNDQSANTNTRAAATTPATPAASTPAATPDELADARATFKNTCSRCHKEDGTGGAVKLDDGTTLKVPNLRDEHAAKHTDEQFSKKIQNGGDGMPRFKDRLSQPQIDALVRLIRHDFESQAATTSTSASPAPSR
jgi:mono/diheme cytochrome c family protein